MRRVLSLALLLLAIPGCLGGCFIVICYNPMAIGFLSNSVVQNDTNETLYVTPMTFWFKKWQALPLHKSRSLPFPLAKDSEFEIRAHESRTFIFDADDASADGVLIKTADGRLLFQNSSSVSGIGKNFFRIDSLANLPAATTEQIAAASGNPNPWLYYSFMMAPLAWLCCFALRMFFPKERRGGILTQNEAVRVR